MDETQETTQAQEQNNAEHQQENLQGQGQGNSQKASLFNDNDGNETHSNENDQSEQSEQSEQPEGNSNEHQALTADDITIPEGFEYDRELGDSFLTIVNEEGISKKAAQRLIDFDHARSVARNAKMLEGLKAAETERAKKFEADMAAEKAEWLKQCEADKEFGGQNWDASQAVIDRAAKSFDGAVKVMQAYNLNTHPEIVRMFYRTGQLMGEDQSRTSGGAAKQTDPAEAIFGESLREFYKRRDNH